MSIHSKSSARTLLFGEIDPSGAPSLHSNGSLSSVCNLTLSTSPTFMKFWLQDTVRETFLASCDTETRLALRLVCHDFAGRTASHLFRRLDQSFRPSTFTKPGRMAALSRIGPHVQEFSLRLSHGWKTYLPPLIDPATGDEIAFSYKPTPPAHDRRPSTGHRNAQFGGEDIAGLLLEQYPPLFHAATNVPSVLRAFSAMPNLRHLCISCDGLAHGPRHRRSVVDYLLISLRVALERAPLTALDSLSLISMHEEGLLCLQPTVATKRWHQIKNISLQLRRHDAHNTRAIKLVKSYLRNFGSLTSLKFRWEGLQGPFPLVNYTDSITVPVDAAHSPHRRKLELPKLREVEVYNLVTDAKTIGDFIFARRKTLVEFKVEEITFQSGDWDEALDPLTKMCGNDHWKRPEVESMEVPLIMMSPDEPRVHHLENTLSSPSPPMPTPDAAAPHSSTFSGWLSRARSGRTRAKAAAGAGHLKKLVRLSTFAWK